MEKYLVINADDFGLSPGVNAGIIQAVYAGTISSVSMMANMPGFQHAVQLVRQNPKLDVGFHFNLTYGQPISAPCEVPSLIDHTYHFSRETQSWTVNDIQKELAAQWRKLVVAEIRPTHIDSHHHIQRYKPVRKLMASLAIAQLIPMRRLTPTYPGSYPIRTDYLIPDVYFGKHGLSRLLTHLQHLKPGITELVCHPGYVDDELLKTSSWTYVREEELRVFLNPRVKLELFKNEIFLTNYQKFYKIP